MAKSVVLARNAMAYIKANLPAATLSRTSYAAAVVKLANGNRAVMITEAGASASGISGPLLDKIGTSINAPVFGGADPVQGAGTWHMNDAEQQALRILYPDGGLTGALAGAVVKAVVANRNICASCTFFLQQRGFIVNGDEAVAP